MKKIPESTKVTLTLGQIKRLVKEASKFDPELVADGNKLVKEAIKTMEQNAENIEKIDRLRELVGRFTSEAVEKARQAKAASSAAAAQVKADAKPLDDAAKELATTLDINGDVFFSAKQNGQKVGVILTTVKKVISQDQSNAAILERLEDPEFIANNEKLRGISQRMIAMLEEARDQLREIGFFDKGEEELTQKAQGLYTLDDDEGEFTPLKEGFKDIMGKVGAGFMRAIRKVGEWFQRTFLPDYSEQEAEYVETLDEWNGYVAELEREVRGMAVAERRIRKVREARRRRLARH